MNGLTVGDSVRRCGHKAIQRVEKIRVTSVPCFRLSSMILVNECVPSCMMVHGLNVISGSIVSVIGQDFCGRVANASMTHNAFAHECTRGTTHQEMSLTFKDCSIMSQCHTNVVL